MSRTRMVAAIAMLCTCFEHLASVAAEPDLAMMVSGECPSRNALIAALEGLLPDVEIVDEGAQTPSLVVVSDASPNYVAAIAGVTRRFVDPPASCVARAHKVAVFAFSALAPPAVAKRVPDETPLAIGVASDAYHATVPRLPANDLMFWFETSGGFDVASGARGDQVNAGLDLHLAFGGSTFQAVIGGAIAPPRTLTMAPARVSVLRIPVDLAVRGRLSGGAIAAVVEIGPRFTLQMSNGLDVGHPLSAVRLETGLRIAPRLEVAVTRLLAAYLQMQAEYVPWPSRFWLPDVGEVGQMPSWWVGAGLGFAIQIK